MLVLIVALYAYPPLTEQLTKSKWAAIQLKPLLLLVSLFRTTSCQSPLSIPLLWRLQTLAHIMTSSFLPSIDGPSNCHEPSHWAPSSQYLSMVKQTYNYPQPRLTDIHSKAVSDSHPHIRTSGWIPANVRLGSDHPSSPYSPSTKPT